MTRVLGDFEGRWSLDRQIIHAGQPPAHFGGTASWSRVQEGLAYHESGTLQVAGHPPMQAERRYLWQPDLTVWFDDGRYFHQVPADGGATGHWCDPDQYDVLYDFSAWPHFQVTWQVKGPAKDYTMISCYTRGD